MLLIVSQSKRNARLISDTFHYMSILSYATTPSDSLSEVSELYRAILIVNPEEFPDIKDYIKRVKNYKSDIPILALTDLSKDTEYKNLFDGVIARKDITPTIASKIINYLNQNNYSCIGEYLLAGFDASWNKYGITYFSKRIKFTKTEAMILRYLIRSYPLPRQTKDILKYCFKPSKAPEASSIRTHLSIMNKKYYSITNRKLFKLVQNEGYIILTPEIMENEKLL